MMGFEYEEQEGLFTFYRSQAEYEELKRKNTENTNKPKQKKSKKISAEEEQVSHKKFKRMTKCRKFSKLQIHQKYKGQPQTQKQVPDNPKSLTIQKSQRKMSKQEYMTRAKRYIKQLQDSLQRKKKYDPKMRINQNQFYISEEPAIKTDVRQEQNKQQDVKMKVNCIRLGDKESVRVREFSSREIIDWRKQKGMSRKYSIQLLPKIPTPLPVCQKQNEKLPKIKQDTCPSSPVCFEGKPSKKRRMYVESKRIELIMKEEQRQNLKQNSDYLNQRLSSNRVRFSTEFSDTKFVDFTSLKM